MAKSVSRSLVQIHLPERWPDPTGLDEPPLRWMLRRGFRTEDGVSHLREIPRADEVIVVLPVARVLFSRAHLPPGQPAKAAKLVPFAVEDSIALAPEDIHGVALEEVRDGQRLVAVIDRQWFTSALAEFDAVRLAPSRVIVESALVEAEPGTWTIVWSGDGGFAALGGIEAIALDASIDGRPPLSLKLAADEQRTSGEALNTVRVLLTPGASPPDVGRWSQSLHVPVTIAGEWRPEQIDARRAPCPDLRLGAGRPGWRSEGWLARFRPALILGAAVLALHVLLTLGDWVRLQYQTRTLQNEMDTAFRKAFPDARAVQNAALQMGRNVADLRRAAGQPDPTDLVPLLARLAPTFAMTGARPTALRYERGELEFELAVPPGDTRESVANRLKAAGLAVRVERVTAAPGGSVATVRVAAEGGA